MPSKKNDDIGAFEARLSTVRNDLEKLTDRPQAIETQTDKLTELLSVAADVVGDAALKDRQAGVVGNSLKDFQDAKHTKAALAVGAKLAKDADQIETNSQAICKAADVAQKEANQVSADISRYLKTNKKHLQKDEISALQDLKKKVERMAGQFDTLVKQPATAAVVSSKSHLATFQDKAADVVADLKEAKKKFDFQLTQLALDPRKLGSSSKTATAIIDAFKEKAKDATVALKGAWSGSPGEATAIAKIGAAQKCQAELVEMHKTLLANLKAQQADIKKSGPDQAKVAMKNFLESESFKKAQALSKKLTAATDTQGKILKAMLAKLDNLPDGPPPPKNPIPDGVRKKLGDPI